VSAMRYVGGGSFYIGVPARDLTAAEAQQYREVIEGSPLYEPAQTDEQPASESTPADDSSEGE
jgi:hypothetical protein